MASDVKLQGEQVRVEAWDLVLDAEDRRKEQGGDRRALVHDQGDALTLNWGHDYPGGVNLLGVRMITKDPGFVMGVSVDGGLHVRGGSVQILDGNKLLLADPTPGGDLASGEIQQTDNGLRVSGGTYNGGKDEKPVTLRGPVASKSLKWGDWSETTRTNLKERASKDTSSPGVVTFLAGSALTANRTVRINPRGAVPCEFDIVDTFIQLLDELSELRNRVAQLEASS